MELIESVTNFSIEKDIVRPEYDVEFRTSEDREVFAWGYNINPYQSHHALCCVAYCNQIPIDMKQLESYSSYSKKYFMGHIAVAYTVWSCSEIKGMGRFLMMELQKHFREVLHIHRLVTLSPRTEMAKNFHLSNGATLLSTNADSYNFEYEI